MKKRYTLYNICKASALLFALLIGSAAEAWGQDSYKIITQSDKEFPQASVPTIVDTVYIKSGESRELTIPEFKSDVVSSGDYDWYFRWYRMDGNGNVVDINESSFETNPVLRSAQNGNAGTRSLFWYHYFFQIDYDTNKIANPHSEAATLTYIGSENNNTIVVCDVSPNIDGLGYHSFYEAESYEITEPTIGRRHVFVILDASEISTALDAKNDSPYYEYDITVPDNAAVNLQLPMTADNYYWNSESNHGYQFKWERNDGRTDTVASNKKVFLIGTVTADDVVDVYALNSDDSNADSKLIARFNLTVQEGSGFLMDTEVPDDRKPETDSIKYKLVGSQNFDTHLGFAEASEITVYNNMATVPLESGMTSYVFSNPSIDIIHEFLTPRRDGYGLYRSACMPGVSDNSSSFYRSDNETAKGHPMSRGSTVVDAHYDWFFANRYGEEYNEFYDRTYVDSEGSRSGYFLYLDASELPGEIVSVPIEGDLCAETELTITAWVANMTSTIDITKPNLNFLLKGNAGDEEVILHRFTTGDLVSKTHTVEMVKTVLARWYQICYKVTLPSDIDQYESFSVEVQNNAGNTDGADYAIDDIRIYKSLPNIRVERNNACGVDVDTLTISSDYETVLQNMGWTEGDVVQSSAERPEEYAKYGYGLPTDNYWGNVYFSFLEGDITSSNSTDVTNEETYAATSEDLKKEISPKEVLEDSGQYRWVRVNRNLTNSSYQSVYSFRIAVNTVKDSIPTSQEEARALEKQYNFQAVLDYNADGTKAWATVEGRTVASSIDIPNNATSVDELTDDEYDALIEDLYSILLIPRIRVPWIDTDGTLYLYKMPVGYTDLMHQGETYEEDGNIKTATGNYHVMLFTGSQIASYGTPLDVPYSEITSPCSLISDFTVYAQLIIKIETDAEVDGNVCAGSVHTVSATLINSYDGTEWTDSNFSFDWFMGSMEEYVTYENLAEALEAYRNSGAESVEAWEATETNAEYKALLLELLEDNMLVLDTSSFQWRITSEYIVAIPFNKDASSTADDMLYCLEPQEAEIPMYTDDVPELHPGYVNDILAGETSLRLGHPNMDGSQKLKVPLKEDYKMAEDANSLQAPENASVRLNRVPDYPELGEIVTLNITRNMDEATVTITLSEDAKNYLQEGKSYELLIPFAQYDENGEAMSDECDGQILLPVKIVPEYLTWKGGDDGDWRTDAAWNQSTKAELFMGDGGDTDANGTDDVTNAYAPLYFTKVTVPDGTELQLQDASTETDAYSNIVLKEWATDGSDSIRYEMAVADANGNVKPFYINTVSEIYFKPNATLYRQDYLTYDTARVEFEMTESIPYWMSSPLKGVYAGDMYAPTNGGKQETPAFEHISYNTIDYNRWNPAFYQKAWNKAVAYATNADGSSSVDVDAVESNWSIEYNDVWVPYSVGKGFYARVEEKDVKVRLPKADTDYTYEMTRSLSEKGDRTDNGQLADANVTITLDTDVDGDGEHYLVGNPYMAYLDMEKFFAANTNLVQGKFWILDRESSSVVAGTPDVDWDDAASGTTGYVAPMTAFFVELSSSADVNTITFTKDMMATKSTAESNENLYTRSYVATNPQLTITAKSAAGTSRAAVIQRSDASNQYDAEEDAVVLLDSELDAPTVYTVAGNYASAVNVIHDYSNVPLGVYADDNEDVELTIEGISQLTSSLYLYDAVTRSSTELTSDSYTLNLTGSSHGRYSLTTEESISVESDIRIYSPYAGQIIVVSTASDNLEQVLVYDLSGKMVAHRQNIGSTTCTISVPGNIYLIRAISGQGEAQAKLKVK